MYHMPFNCEKRPWVQEANNYTGTEYTNLPAYKEEPYMPPEKQVRAWMLIYYTETNQRQDKYWSSYSSHAAAYYSPRMKVSHAVKEKAGALTSDARTPDERLKRLYDYCRSTIKNIDHPGSGYTAEQRKDFKENKLRRYATPRGRQTPGHQSAISGAGASGGVRRADRRDAEPRSYVLPAGIDE